MKLALSAIAMAVATVGAQDVEASTPSVTAKFMGASGGMKLSPAADTKAFIMVEQEKIEEVSADGTACKGNQQCVSINLAGGTASWSELKETKIDETNTLYDTTFTSSDPKGDFALMAHLTSTKTTATDVVACNGCASGSGSCKNEEMVCSDPVDMVCTGNATACTEEVTINENVLKFSLALSNMKFASTDNKVKYGIALSQKAGGKAPEVVGSMVQFDGGYMSYPGTAVIKGAAEDKEVDVVVTTSQVGQKTMLNFEFPAFAEGEMLYYDPDLGVGANAGAAVVVSPLVALAAFLVAFH